MGEGESLKVEQEVIKEMVNPKGLKEEKEIKPDPALESLVNQLITRIMDILKQQGAIK
jgi:hypothetical protein